ncbi:SAM-dependent methyltransferase [Alcanivorax sp. HI0033]|jgi:predicted nicotinamide N-methyase|uniref:class I SAM-dependent methyltransferase n=1 Tax=unclassified Alcanivorax TaxID=2638842 RepID=UPI0007B9D959|nr:MULTISPECIES: class I SAM-dependent methyltransferase [unclassified Alcanivorax]KZX76591.1 SAM-dependent methyltransferase [Alcanivorax sp. HI0013]KZX81579.1 SAM-dependent methyltransferase [Alcanivorax sp. HI0011]KZY16153.1 SAM-dependent methyltransferase [Alcanivorax sp. HI0035]KZX63769.1 SAM-dependent methyltransferase [Alcanivorax sp. HI0003]KZX70967.1 SAM-dependent methyltransferase [Alcanivorax sp. HI0007]
MSGTVIRAGEPHTIRTRGITLLRSGHREIRRLKRANHTPSIHGNKVWNSSFLIMDHLTRRKVSANEHMMDIGCGWGPLSIFAAKRFGCRVTAVDADPDVFPYLDLHAQINKVQITRQQDRFEKLTKKRLADVDIIAGADICFWDELTPVLFNLIRRGLRSGVKQVIIADPGRSPFYALAEKCENAGMDARVVERRTKTPKSLSADLLIINN